MKKFEGNIKVGKINIGEGQKIFIIAEAGVNHDGDIKKAKMLVDIAKEAGVDAVKFQTWITEELMLESSKMAEYAKNNSGETNQFLMLKKLELNYTQFKEIKKYCDEKDILFMSTPDEEKSADFLEKLVPIFKIGSGELTNPLLLEHIAKKKKPIILSTGMGTLKEVKKAVDIIKKSGNEKIVLLHCTSSYPTPFDKVNLNAMVTLKKKIKVPVGYSDHTEGIEIPIAAVTLGACVIEKHFTYDKNAKGPDHKASLSPDELKKMVQSIRNIEQAFGSGIKAPTRDEIKTKEIVRKSIVARNFIKKGTKITDDMLTSKRPANGISPDKIFEVIGKKAKTDIEKDDIISFENIE